MIVDLFSGGGAGWCLAARALGMTSIGIEWGGPECATRAAVGLTTIRADVAQYPPERFAGKVEGLCGLPPCQAFSSAGKGLGLADPRGQMVYEPMRWVRIIRPRWVALEQVPEVLSYWRWISRELAGLGYSTWCGVLNAADYGVPQVRKRAILLASLDRQAVPPAPTHSKTGHADLLGEGLERWVSMAEALGWTKPVVVDTGYGNGRSFLASLRPSRVVDTFAERRWTLRTGGTSMVTGRTKSDVLPYERDVNRPAPVVDCKAAHSWSVAGEGEDSITLEPWELGVLQGFPADHPWQPPHVSRQIGNAIPPPLAEACLRAITGIVAREAAA